MLHFSLPIVLGLPAILEESDFLSPSIGLHRCFIGLFMCSKKKKKHFIIPYSCFVLTWHFLTKKKTFNKNFTKSSRHNFTNMHIFTLWEILTILLQYIGTVEKEKCVIYVELCFLYLFFWFCTIIWFLCLSDHFSFKFYHWLSKMTFI